MQHSADGQAYQQYDGQAQRLALAFTGQDAHAVWCWSPTAPRGKAQLTAARAELARTFGHVGSASTDPPAATPSLQVQTHSQAQGWAVASWLVTHAGQYRLHKVRYAGYEWQAKSGTSGWIRHGGTVAASGVQAS